MNPSNPQDDIASAKSGESAVTLEELQYHFEGLRSLFFLALLGLIIATLAVDVCFVRRQMVAVRSQVDDQRPKINKMVAEYKKSTEPLVRNFTASMQSFAASNHDFQPIFERYRPYLGPTAAAAAPATTAQPIMTKPPQ